MKNRFLILLFSYFLLFNACMVDNFEEASLLLDSITEVRLSSNDTLFIKKDGSFEVKYALRYFSKQGEVSLKNTIKPKLLLNGTAVEKAEIDLRNEAVYTLQVEFPNKSKILSNEKNIRVLSLVDAITEIKLVPKRDSNVLIPQLEAPTFDDLFKIELLLATGERLVVAQEFLDFEVILNGVRTETFQLKDFELGKITEVQLGINKVLSNPVKIEALTVNDAVKEIKIEYNRSSNILIPQLENPEFDELFKVEISLITGEKLDLEQKLVGYKYVLNGTVFSDFQLKHFETGKITEFKIIINDVQSNPIKLEVLSLREAVVELNIKTLNGIVQINKKETTGILTDFLEISAKLKNGATIDLKPYREFFHIEFNQAKLNDLTITKLPDGKFKLRATVGQVFSNAVDLEVFDPMTYIKRIDLILDERTRNPYAVAGETELDFSYQVIGMDNSVLNIAATLVVDGQKQNSFKNIPISKAGTVNIHAEISGKKSNTIQVISRQDKVLQKIRVPVIFHVLDNLNKAISRETVEFEILKLNQAFANEFFPALTRSGNAVEIFMEFFLADKNESGTLLAERGINRIASGGETFGDFSEANANYLFQRMWDPRRYVNVFIGRMDRWGGYAYFPVLKDIELPGVWTMFENYVLDYPYATVMSDNAMGNVNDATLAHEIGHMLALYHTFDRTGQGQTCLDGDFCFDTETHLIDATNSFFTSPSNIQENCQEETFYSANIMDYVTQRNSFTYDQRERIRTAALYSPFFAKEANYINGRLSPFMRGKINYDIKPQVCANPHHFGRKYHHKH
jgi:hypothetical protein